MNELDVQRLVEAACETTQLNDFGEDSWQEGLEEASSVRCVRKRR